MTPKISIIIPIYNCEEYLRECLESVIHQLYENLEIICVDDGSTDKSASILDEYAAKDSRLIVIHKQNGGVSSARNIGIDQSTGDFIGFVDGDDYCALNMFSVMYQTLAEDQSDVVICSFIGSEVPEYKHYVFSGEEAIIEMNKGSYFMGHLPNKMFRADLIKGKYLDSSVHVCEDLLYLHYVLNSDIKVSYINTQLYYYRYTPNSALHSVFHVKYLSCDKAAQLIQSFFKENLPQHANVARRTAMLLYYSLLCKIIKFEEKSKKKEYLKEYLMKYRNVFRFRDLYNCTMGEKIRMISLFFNVHLYELCEAASLAIHKII